MVLPSKLLSATCQRACGRAKRSMRQSCAESKLGCCQFAALQFGACGWGLNPNLRDTLGLARPAGLFCRWYMDTRNESSCSFLSYLRPTSLSHNIDLDLLFHWTFCYSGRPCQRLRPLLASLRHRLLASLRSHVYFVAVLLLSVYRSIHCYRQRSDTSPLT